MGNLEEWKKRGREIGAEFLIVVVDTEDWEDFPVFVYKASDFESKFNYYESTYDYYKIKEVIRLKPKNIFDLEEEV